MAFHVPFEHRNRSSGPGPVYIGFEQPRRPKKRFNGWAFFGFFTTIISLGLLSPLGLLMSLIGCRKNPRTLAKFGATLSLLGTLFWGALFGIAYTHHQHEVRAAIDQQYAQRVAAQVEKTKSILGTVVEELEEHKDANDGMLPSGIDCNMLLLKHVDPWGKELRFDVQDSSHALIRSAGPDGTYNTSDDVSTRIDGETAYDILLPVD